ncbi:hypothetical protein ALO95_200003 [Pseudomonas syringae pv. antirrhini]|uniref:Uncharacterized protein n=1 Tax=Pseudomonas syringae pv. antirrhini TaxID=251702 RepID=A0A0P9JE49_9PSED|nr:hypothetical protein ALO88_200002 [Pseudomonas syringae pv. antirrhini]RMP34189.1 hypothetical protein ALQ23_200171 [Pseudomonas syringae pv. antirrhini]RMW26096.1 hypothetical protein ALO95_200003 [Pseudomonas syringae pv. antirrhini]
MTRARLDMVQEGELWEMALKHFGSDGLLKVVLEIWSHAAPPPKPVVEYLSTKQVSQEVLNILKIAQERVGAFVAGRTPVPDTVTLYCRHASDLVDGLITRLPKEQLSRAWRGSCLEIDVGI